MQRDAQAGRVAASSPPAWRFDIAIEEDLIEEIARVHGFDRIPEDGAAGASAVARRAPRRGSATTPSTDLLVQRGYHEAITYSFIEPKLQDAVRARTREH